LYLYIHPLATFGAEIGCLGKFSFAFWTFHFDAFWLYIKGSLIAINPWIFIPLEKGARLRPNVVEMGTPDRTSLRRRMCRPSLSGIPTNNLPGRSWRALKVVISDKMLK
jgi:hypothetical protein